MPGQRAAPRHCQSNTPHGDFLGSYNDYLWGGGGCVQPLLLKQMVPYDVKSIVVELWQFRSTDLCCGTVAVPVN